jgi:hypothetical protein
MSKKDKILICINKNGDSSDSRFMSFEHHFKKFKDDIDYLRSFDLKESINNIKNIDFVIIDENFDMSTNNMNGKGLYKHIQSCDKSTLPYIFVLTNNDLEKDPLLEEYADFAINIDQLSWHSIHAQIKSVVRRRDSGNGIGLLTISEGKFLFNEKDLEYAYPAKNHNTSKLLQLQGNNQESKLLIQYIEQAGKNITPNVPREKRSTVTGSLRYGIAEIIHKNNGSKISYGACLEISKKILKSMGSGEYRYDNTLNEAWLDREIKSREQVKEASTSQIIHQSSQWGKALQSDKQKSSNSENPKEIRKHLKKVGTAKKIMETTNEPSKI